VLPSQTTPVPCADPKFEPATVTCVPAVPEAGDTLVMEGTAVTVKLMPLLARPPTVTTTLPVVAPVGTVMVMLVAFQFAAVPALVPLAVTVLVPWLAPKSPPVMVKNVPTAPEEGDKLVMLGGTVTMNVTPLLATPPTVTTTSPVVAPLGTVTVMPVSLQLEAVPLLVPLKVTVLVPWLAPKPVPVMVTVAPTGPETGETVEIVPAVAALTRASIRSDSAINLRILRFSIFMAPRFVI
jgi:uncharacterized membrane protein (DUF441 family)